MSICLPVYNGERYLRETIPSILAQRFTDFELIISDNASVDGTGDICRDAARQDDRVRYCRAEVNRGLAWNHNRAFKLSRGRYVMWTGHDDLLGPDYLGSCLDALERDPQAVLCYTNFNYIDCNGGLLRRVEHRNGGSSPHTHERFASLIQIDHACDAMFGLMRRAALRQTGLHGAFPDSDRVLLAEMGLRGRFIVLPGFHFSRRMHDAHLSATVANLLTAQERASLFDPSLKGLWLTLASGNDVRPFCREFFALLSAILRASLGWSERYQCLKRLYWWASYHQKLLSQDVVRILRTTMSSLVGIKGTAQKQARQSVAATAHGTV